MKKIMLFACFLVLMSACIVTEQPAEEEAIENDFIQEDTAKQKDVDEATVEQDTELKDSKETQNTKEKIAEESENMKILKQLVENAPKAYRFWLDKETDQYAVTVFGNKRSIGKYYEYYDNIYWDTNTKEMLLFVGELRDSWWCKRKNLSCKNGTFMGVDTFLPAFFKFSLTGDREIDNKIIPDEVQKWYWVKTATYGSQMDKTKWFVGFYEKSPVDWLTEYKDQEPIKIEQKKITIKGVPNTISCDYSIYFQDKENDNATIIFRIDHNYKVPLVVEMQEDGRTTNRYRYWFETRYYEHHVEEKKPITEEMVLPPENYIIVTIEDRKAYDEFKEGS